MRNLFSMTPNNENRLRMILGLGLATILFGLVELDALAQSGSARWEPEIHAFEASDRTNPPPQHAILFTGSSSVRFWKSLSQDFPGKLVINRGFGGSEIADSTAFAPRIIFPYQPRIIVLYAGDNDLAAGKTPDQVVADYRRFVSTVHEHLPQTRIAFISIKPSPSRWRLKDRIIEANRRIADMKEPYLVFIDIFPQMLGPGGNPRQDLFKPDGLHPNAKAYRLWAKSIAPYLVGD
jgi:lysophospholipase L1-like esterase